MNTGNLRRTLVRSALLAALASTLTGVGAVATAAEKLIFGNPNARGLNLGMGPIFYAREMGYFSAEGIEVEFVNFGGSGVLYPQIASKAVDLGWPNPDVLIKSNQTGQDPYPVVFFYNHLRRNVWELAVPASSGIYEVSDLKGKRIGVGNLTMGNLPSTRAILKRAGVDPEKEVEFLPVGMGGSAFKAFKSKQIDALNLFDTMHTILEGTGSKLRRLTLSDDYLALFNNGFATHADNLKDKRKALVGFGRAIAKGTVGCYANLEACVHIVWKQDPALKRKGRSDEANMRAAVKILESRGKSYWAFPGGARGNWGMFPDGGWENFVSYLHAGGAIKTRDIPVKRLYTNDLVADMNAFDWDAVESRAKALK